MEGCLEGQAPCFEPAGEGRSLGATKGFVAIDSKFIDLINREKSSIYTRNSIEAR
jgi:hypothetical protein